LTFELMRKAVSLAEKCNPMAERIPKVGAVIALGEAVIGQGYRGSGQPGDDDHAEKSALAGVSDSRQLPRATIYTTLEPCTPEVRSDPFNCCTELIRHAGVKRVFIGILDPNQGVTGKGLWKLQSSGIEVELFPPTLAEQIRALNESFIREQQRLGIRITNPTSGESVTTFDKGGVVTIEGDFLNPPGDDVFALTNIGSRWWPQPHSLDIGPNNTWKSKVHVGSYGAHRIYIVRANELGAALINYYRKVIAQQQASHAHIRLLKDRGVVGIEDIKSKLGDPYPSIEMARPPKGLEVLDQIDIFVEHPPGVPS
jgi:pyrimidine deaminase RibD-like protein